MSIRRIEPGISLALHSILIFALMAAGASTIEAQEGKGARRGKGVASSGMEQGEAVISVRTDVRVSMKGTRGATKKQVTAIGEAIRSKIQQLKICYGKLVSEDPAAAVGAFRLVISFKAKNDRPGLEFPRAGSSHAGLEKCIRKSLGTASLERADRPAAAILMLDFTNTRARGQELMEKASDPTSSVDVQTAGDGSLTASWKTENGKMAFQVAGKPPSADRDTVAAVLSGLRRAFGSFLDCRRRAGKRGMSPAGKTVSEVRLMRGGRASAKNLSSTLKLAPAATCIERVYRRLEFEGTKARSRVKVTVDFYE